MGYSYSLVLQDNDQPNLIVPVSWSGRSVLLCTDCGVAGSLLIPPGDFISPEAMDHCARSCGICRNLIEAKAFTGNIPTGVALVWA